MFSIPTSPITHWKRGHSLAVVVTSALFALMLTWRPGGLRIVWLISIATLALFTLIVGHGITGVWKGAFIDERNRMSLSRLQMVTWTVIVIAAFTTIVMARLAKRPITQAEIVAAMDIGVPATIWMLLGISATSLVGSPLIKNAKKDPNISLPAAKEQQLLQAQGKTPADVEVEGQLVKNRSIDDASLADIFMGEVVENATYLDVGKIQMFVFTVLLVLAYSSAVAQLFESTATPASLPDVGDGMLPLLGISHAGYLMSKAAASTKP